MARSSDRSTNTGDGRRHTGIRRVLLVVAIGAAMLSTASFVTGDSGSGIGLILTYAAGLLGLVALGLGIVVAFRKRQ